MSLLNLSLVTPPIVEPVTLAEAKCHLRVDFNDDDALIAGLIVAARQYCEKYTQLYFYNQTWQRTLDYFPIYMGGTTTNTNDRYDWMYYGQYWKTVMIQLPGKVQSITSITYLSSDSDDPTTLDPSAYVTDLTSTPCRIVPAQGCTWPLQELYAPGSVAVTYVAGSFGDGAEVDNCPQTIKLAMLMLLDQWYNNRSNISDKPLTQVPLAVTALLDCNAMRSMDIL